MSQNEESEYAEEMGEEELKMLFNNYDKEGKGYITTNDMVLLLKNMDIQGTDEQIREIIREVNTKDEDKIFFEDFIQYMVERIYDEEEDEEEDDFDKVVQAFRVFDKENLGYLTKEEFVTILTKLGDPLNNSEIERLHKEIDLYENGKIFYTKLIDRLRNRR